MSEHKLDISALRALAEKATPGEWRHEHHPGGATWKDRLCGDAVLVEKQAEIRGFKIGQLLVEDAAFIAALNPATVLRLLDEYERMRNTLKSLVGYEPFGGGTHEPNMVSECLASLSISDATPRSRLKGTKDE